MGSLVGWSMASMAEWVGVTILAGGVDALNA